MPLFFADIANILGFFSPSFLAVIANIVVTLVPSLRVLFTDRFGWKLLAEWEQYTGVTVDRSFDVWSLGMAILHLHLGRGYFQGSSDLQVCLFFMEEA